MALLLGTAAFFVPRTTDGISLDFLLSVAGGSLMCPFFLRAGPGPLASFFVMDS